MPGISRRSANGNIWRPVPWRMRAATGWAVRNRAVAALLPDLIFSSECRRVVFPIVRYLRGNKSPEPIDLDRLQLAQFVRRQVLGALERAQIFLEYPAVAPNIIFGALCRGACVLQRDGQCGIELLQHCKDAFES